MANFLKQNATTGVPTGTAMVVADLPTAIPNANLATMANNTVKGNISGSTATPSDVSAVSTATASTVAVRDTNANVAANSFIEGLATTATAAGNTILTVASKWAQQFTGTTTQTVTLPDATTLVVGQSFMIMNRSTGVVTVNANGGGLIQTMAAGSQTIATVITNGSSAGTWDSAYSTTVGLTRTINAQSGTTYTFVLADGSAAGGNPLVTFSNAGATTVTVPPHSSVAFPVGTQIDCIQQGAGAVTFAPGSGVTLNSNGGLVIGAQYVGVSLVNTATDTWTIMGFLT